MKSLREQALDIKGVPSEADSLRSFRSLCSTDAGAFWLEQAVDPMHDRGVRSASMPDHVSGRSVVQVITKRFTVSAPSTTSYDALVRFDCDLNNNRLSDANLVYDTPTLSEKGAAPSLKYAGLATGRQYGGVTTSTGNVGSDLSLGAPYITAPWFNGNDPATQQSEFPSGGYRLVGGSIEVYNTTPQLYAAGSVVCYRHANRANLLRNLQLVSSTATMIDANTVVVQYPRPPTNLANAQAIPDSVAMRAVEGCYMPIVVNTDDVLKYPEYGIFVVADRQDRSAAVPVQVIQPISGVVDPVSQTSGNWQLPHDCQPCGAYFAGLSPQTTLDVVVRFIVEIFPQIEDTVLTPLTRPSAPADDAALESYRVIIANMPIAVPVAWNGSGDWLRSVIKIAKPLYKTVQPAIKTAVKALPHGATAWAAANAAVDAVTMVDKLVKTRKRAKKQGK